MTEGLRLGIPGVYPAPEQADRSVTGVRLDVAGFAGISGRGPVDEPVPVASWSEFGHRFGGRDPGCPGLLAHAVAAFFDQGGRRAWVVRVAPPPDPSAHARHRLGEAATTPHGPLEFVARDEGSWGDGLLVTLTFTVARQFTLGPADVRDREVTLPPPVTLPAGSLLRFRGPGLPAAGVLRWVTATSLRDAGGERRAVAVLDAPPSELRRDPPPGGADARWTLAEVTGLLTVVDRATDQARSEEFAGLGLHPAHPRWLVAQVATSLWVRPDGAWLDGPVTPADPLLHTPAPSRLLAAGRDRYERITDRDFFDGGPVGLSPEERAAADVGAPGERPHRGVDALVTVAELGLVSVPDLLWDGVVEVPAEAEAPEPRWRPDFVPCRPPDPPPATVRGPVRGAELLQDESVLPEVVRRQRLLVERAERDRRYVVLLDLPPRLSAAAVPRWRFTFDSTYAAAYHPWLGVVPGDGPRGTGAAGGPPAVRDAGLVLVPPSAFAAGIAAARERRLGLTWGPAGELAVGAVSAPAAPGREERELLFAHSVNVFAPERDGFRLTSARTLSRAPEYRQLTVRRLVTGLRLTLERELQWLAFEPHTAELRSLLVRTLTTFLDDWFRRGAFTGDTAADAFFVRCDDVLNPPAQAALGRLVTEIGMAPAAPVEFVILRLSLDAGGPLTVTEGAA